MSSDRPDNSSSQEGIIFTDGSTGNFSGSVTNNFFATSRPLEWTGDEAPNNLRRLGIGASAVFVGRSQELQQLDGLVMRKGAVAIAGVSGMGGIGKTELAGQYARRCLAAGRFPGGGGVAGGGVGVGGFAGGGADGGGDRVGFRFIAV